MLRRTFAGALAATALVLPVTTVVSAPSAAAAEILATSLTYDDSQSTQYSSQISAAVGIWNAAVSNVQIKKATSGQRANIRFVADPGWPRANLGPVRPGQQVTVWMGREAVDDGYDVIRIAAHEMGHSLGLPDIKPGPCSSLMSGSTGGVDCKSRTPNASEAARVQRNYAGTLKTVDTSVVVSEAAF
ncbi:snapalysin [Kibdelosporangium banguiense]|uniref:Extracellular small neutral protease n=1 Tax=Kibdelosporangium banguiense TaxID=1365924 RepID=A0ABS4TPM6_9PSEU|nr:snapalysin family zinc-dependent metalloprotease [Kibdelosporangium banguiense]MBP2326347.1 snapalysin [Kibdelosporangium banguiense]